MDDLARRIEADKTRELVGFVAEGKCASIARAVVAGGNARAILRDRDECAALGVETGSTLLHVAVRGGFVSASKLLISQGADPSIADDVSAASAPGLRGRAAPPGLLNALAPHATTLCLHVAGVRARRDGALALAGGNVADPPRGRGGRLQGGRGDA